MRNRPRKDYHDKTKQADNAGIELMLIRVAFSNSSARSTRYEDNLSHALYTAYDIIADDVTERPQNRQTTNPGVAHLHPNPHVRGHNLFRFRHARHHWVLRRIGSCHLDDAKSRMEPPAPGKA